jgi:hypothetical protein
MTAAFAWQLVALSRGLRGAGIAASIVVGALAAVCIVSDPLVLAAAVVPWMICVTPLALRHRARRPAVLLTVCVAVAVASLIVVWAAANHIVERGNTGFAFSMQGITDGLRTTVATLAGLPSPEAVRTVGLLQVYVYADDVSAALPTATHP